MKHIILISFLALFFSCKNNKTETINPEVESIKEKYVKDDIFRVAMEVQVGENDKFQLFYVDDEPENGFNENKRIAKNIKGSDEYQAVEFVLPEKSLPYKFRIDLGENNFETKVLVKTIKISYNEAFIEVNDSVLTRFLKPNIYLEKTLNGFLRKKVSGRCDPFLLSTPLLNKKMEIEL